MTISEARLRQLSELLTKASIEGASGIHYYPSQLIGEGGQGWVYRAGYDEPDGPWVVVKILRPDVVNEEALARFLREADVLRKLGQSQAPSPNVVRFYDHGICRYDMPDGETYALPFTVLEYVNGMTLAQIQAQTPGRGLSAARVRRLFRQVARALALIHSAQIVHRDLKPSNLIIATEATQEVAKITDFGLVKRFDIDAKGTMALAGASVGYAPPEQFELGNRRVSPRTDLFSFAAVLYEALAGKPAFGFQTHDTPFQVLSRILSGPRPQLTGQEGVASELQERRDLLAVLDRELERATRADPGERHESVLEFWETVEAALRMAAERTGTGTTKMPARESQYPRRSESPPPRPSGSGPQPSLSQGAPAASQQQAAHQPAAQQAASHQPVHHGVAPTLNEPSPPRPAPLATPPPRPVAHPATPLPHAATQTSGAVGAGHAGTPAPHAAAAAGGGAAPSPHPSSPQIGGSGEYPSTRSGDMLLPAHGYGQPPRDLGAPPGVFVPRPTPTLPDRAWAMAFGPEGRAAYALGRFGLLRAEGGGAWSPSLLPATLDPALLRGVLITPGGEAVVYGERGALWGQGTDGVFAPWTPAEPEVIWHSATLIPHPAEILLVGEHLGQRLPLLGILRPGQPLARRMIENVRKLQAATRLVSGGILACGDNGELVYLGNGPPEPVAWGRTGHLSAVIPAPDGGAHVVGSGGHALYVSAAREARLEPVQTTRDLLCLAMGPSATPWAGGQDARLLRRTATGWMRVPLPPALTGNIRALHAGPALLALLLDDGQILEGAPA